MNIKEGSKPWIHKNKMYQPVNKGGLNCIELSFFFKAIKLKWMKRYDSEQYKDFWTNILDEVLKVTPTSREQILKWGSEQFEPTISNCKSSTIKTLLQCMQELTEKFVTPPETGDNRFIFQPLFQNKNLKYQKQNHKRKRLVTFQQLDFKLPSNTAVTINELYNMEKFISYEEFCEKISFIHEGGYLALKFHINAIFKKNSKYPPPIINKSVNEHNIESLTKLFSKKGKGSKKFRKVLFSQKEVKSNTSSWKTRPEVYSSSSGISYSVSHS